MDFAAWMDAAQGHPLYRIGGVLLGIAVLVGFAVSEPPEGLSVPA